MEREIVGTMLLHGCPADFPENIHMDIDMLSRIIGAPKAKIIEVVKNMGSLGFVCRIKSQKHDKDAITFQDILYLEWNSLAIYVERSLIEVADIMVQVISGDMCPHCAKRCIRDNDYSLLSNASKTGHPSQHDAV